MENRKGMMKSFLCENLRDLMLRNVFEKITIKQICDETGVIRATFYNYFEDKYDCLNSIVYHDFVTLSEPVLKRGEMNETLAALFETIDKNREFYRIAYNVTGQNSFEDMVRENLAIVLKKVFDQRRKPGYLEKYSNDLLSHYYAECIAFDIRIFLFHKGQPLSVQDITKMSMDLMRNSTTDFLEHQS